jgi:hypothetical protein
MARYPIRPIILIGFFVFCLVAFILTISSSSKPSSRAGRLGCMSLLAGPLVGLTFALLACQFGGMHPADVLALYWGNGALGFFVGFLGALVFGVVGGFA